MTHRLNAPDVTCSVTDAYPTATQTKGSELAKGQRVVMADGRLATVESVRRRPNSRVTLYRLYGPGHPWRRINADEMLWTVDGIPERL